MFAKLILQATLPCVLRRVQQQRQDAAVVKANPALDSSHYSRVLTPSPPVSPTNSGSSNDMAEAGTPYRAVLLMELCPGGTLWSALHEGQFHTASQKPAGRRQHPQTAKEYNSGANAARQKPDLQAILDLAYQIATALQYCHSQGVLHQDVTSSNILLSSRADAGGARQAKLADFGLLSSRFAPPCRALPCPVLLILFVPIN